MTTFKDIKSTYHQELKDIYPPYEIDSILKIICEDSLGWSSTDFIVKAKELLPQEQQDVLRDALKELKTYRPVQYITGKAHFYGRMFQVTPATLIPRQETEELIAMIVNDCKYKSNLTIIDIGTGTGCIGISLYKELKNAQVTLMDVSSDALQMAQHNATQLDAAIKPLLADVLTIESLPQQYDIIVSNPPYVRQLEKQEISDNVLKYEPHLALFVEDNNPLIFYKKILELALQHLKPTGVLYFEINQYLSQETLSLAIHLGFNAQIVKDLNGNDRMMRCELS